MKEGSDQEVCKSGKKRKNSAGEIMERSTQAGRTNNGLYMQSITSIYCINYLFYNATNNKCYFNYLQLHDA